MKKGNAGTDAPLVEPPPRGQQNSTRPGVPFRGNGLALLLLVKGKVPRLAVFDEAVLTPNGVTIKLLTLS